MKISSATSVGLIRPLNEDALLVSELDKNGTVLAIVADGMGGHNAGEVASGKAVGIVKEIVTGKRKKKAKNLLLDGIENANREIYEMSIHQNNLSGMGTTMTACIAEEGHVTAAQVGDSRLYLIRENTITQITKDHSLVEMLVENGRITKEEAKSHPQKNVITRAVGTEKDVLADIYEFSVDEKDIILLCSDGLVNMVDDEEILQTINARKDLSSAADKLVEIAEKNGGTDNITVILIEF